MFNFLRYGEKNNTVVFDLTEAEKNKVLDELMKIYLGLSIGGCKASVYQKSRKIKPRNRECDYELRQAEIYLEE